MGDVSECWSQCLEMKLLSEARIISRARPLSISYTLVHMELYLRTSQSSQPRQLLSTTASIQLHANTRAPDGSDTCKQRSRAVHCLGQISEQSSSSSRSCDAGNFSTKHLHLRRAPPTIEHSSPCWERTVWRLPHRSAELRLGHIRDLQM